MSSPSDTPPQGPIHHPVLKLVVGVAAVAVTAAIALNERPVSRHHAPLSQTAAAATSDSAETTTTATAAETGTRP